MDAKTGFRVAISTEPIITAPTQPTPMMFSMSSVLAMNAMAPIAAKMVPVKVLRNCSSIPSTSCLRMAYANNTPIMNDPKMFINSVTDWNELKKRLPWIMSLPTNSPLFIKPSAKMMRAVAPTRKINFMRKPKRIALSSRSSKDASSSIDLGSIL